MIPVVDLYREKRLTLDTSKDLGRNLSIILFTITFAFLFFRWFRKSQKQSHTQYTDHW